MIKKIGENAYRIRVRKTLYNVGIVEQREGDNTFSYRYTIDRQYMISLWRALSISYMAGRVARDFAKEYVRLDWRWSPVFRTKEIAEKFLYYLDRKYNPTPQPVKEFIDIKLWGDL